MKRYLHSALLLILTLLLSSQILAPDTSGNNGILSEDDSGILVYSFSIMDMIAAPTWRITQEAMEEATELGADVIILHLNTYGGEVSAADSIRTKLLNRRYEALVRQPVR